MIIDTVMDWVAALFAVGILLLFFVVILKIWNGTINIASVLEEPSSATKTGGKASLARLQLLLFTIVIAGLYAVLSVKAQNFIEVPDTVLGLMGISGVSFLVSKGIGK